VVLIGSGPTRSGAAVYSVEPGGKVLMFEAGSERRRAVSPGAFTHDRRQARGALTQRAGVDAGPPTRTRF